jgi:3-methyladenine DNA glycosylase/8-oxoguanine DNA glycosylase
MLEKYIPHLLMCQERVGANLMFARRTKTGIKPMFENEFETIASDIGSQTIVVRRANTRFAPTLVSDIGWITTIYPKTYDRLLKKPNFRLFGNAP